MTQPPIVSASTPLLFLHVPKTGGMSLFASMAAVWGENIADLYNVSEGDSEGLRRTITGRSDAVYAGHFSYGLHEWIKGECLYATMLREPLARLESLYFFLRRRWPEFQKRLLGGGAGPGRALLPLPDFHQDFRPWLVAGEESPELFFTSPSLELDNGMVRRFSGHGQDPRPCTGEELRMAKQNLEARFSVVGITERYSETIALMSRVFDLPDFKEQRVNVTSVISPQRVVRVEC